jgi:hypothetical protein
VVIDKDGKKQTTTDGNRGGVVNQYLDAMVEFQVLKPFMNEVNNHFGFGESVLPEDLVKHAMPPANGADTTNKPLRAN